MVNGTFFQWYPVRFLSDTSWCFIYIEKRLCALVVVCWDFVETNPCFDNCKSSSPFIIQHPWPILKLPVNKNLEININIIFLSSRYISSKETLRRKDELHQQHCKKKRAGEERCKKGMSKVVLNSHIAVTMKLNSHSHDFIWFLHSPFYSIDVALLLNSSSQKSWTSIVNRLSKTFLNL